MRKGRLRNFVREKTEKTLRAAAAGVYRARRRFWGKPKPIALADLCAGDIVLCKANPTLTNALGAC